MTQLGLASAFLASIVGCNGLVVTQKQHDVQELAKSWPPYRRPTMASFDSNGAATSSPRQAPVRRPPVLSSQPMLEKIMPYTDWDMQQTAADSLGRMGPAAVPDLIQMLRDPDPRLRANAAKILARIGPEAINAVPVLTDALADPVEPVRLAAARALGQIGPDAQPAVRPLLQLIREGNQQQQSPAP